MRYYMCGVERMAQLEHFVGSVLCSRLLLESIGTQSDFLGEERQRTDEVLAADPLLLYILIQIFERAHPASTMSILLRSSPSQVCKRLGISIVWVDGVDSHSAWR